MRSFEMRIVFPVFLLMTVLSISLSAEKINNVESSGVKLLEVYPSKLFLRTGEAPEGRIKVQNISKANQTLDIKVWLTNDLNVPVGEQNKKITIKPGETKQIDFKWDAGILHKYGHTMHAEVKSGKKLLASGEEYFTSADNVWEVGLAGGHPVAFTADVKTKKQLEFYVNRFRKKYVNTYEKFFWAPDDFADMTPDVEIWYSGQARYHERKEFLKYMAAYARKIGVLPTTYGKSIGSGTAARDVIRKNPEMVYGYGNKMSFNPDTEELSKWQKDSKPYWQGTGWANYNMNDPQTVAKGIDEIINSTKMLGWAGIRFDGHFAAKTGKHLSNGKIVDFTSEMADKQTAENMRLLKEKVRQKFPNYVFGYNYAQCVFAKLLYSQPRESIELCKDSGHIMDEYAKANYGGAHPFRKWSDYAAMLVEEAIIIRRLGGELFPMTGSSGVFGYYQAIFILTAGAHPNGTPYLIKHSFNKFATRYAGILWDKKLEYVWHPEGLIIAPYSVMWRNYVRKLPMGKNRQRLIVHLINPPLQKTATESVRLEKEIKNRKAMRKKIAQEASKKKQKPDFTKLDALPPIKLFPDPQKNINIKIVPQAMDFKWKITKAILLDADNVSQKELPVDKSDRYFAQVSIPELKTWSVLVIDLTRKGE